MNATPQTAAQTDTAVDVTAPLTFIKRGDEKPVFLSAALTGGLPEIKFEVEKSDVVIHDMRAIADRLSVDTQGFELVRAPSAMTDFYDDAAVAEVYHPEVEALVKRELGASRVVIFDTTRRADSTTGAANPDGLRGPADRLHVDYTVNSGPTRLSDVIGADEGRRLGSTGARVAQINVWRPIKGPVERSPLALADAASIQPEDLVETDQVFPDRTGEIYHIAQADGQRWYYASAMTPDEALLIKGWDTDPARARFTPHAAFNPPHVRADAPPRESIEVRTFAIFE